MDPERTWQLGKWQYQVWAVNGAEACGPYTGGHSKHWPSKATGLAIYQAMAM